MNVDIIIDQTYNKPLRSNSDNKLAKFNCNKNTSEHILNMKNKKYNKKEFVKIDTLTNNETKPKEIKKDSKHKNTNSDSNTRQTLTREELIFKNKHLFLKEDKFSNFTENSNIDLKTIVNNSTNIIKEKSKKNEFEKQIKIETKV